MKNKNKITLFLVAALLLIGPFVFYWFYFRGKDGSVKKETPKLSKELNVANWEDYFAKDTVANFEKEFGVKVNLTTYDDEYQIFSEVQSDPSRYDFIIISNVLAKRLIELKLAAIFDLRNIPNLKNISPKFLSPVFDKDNKRSIAYLWGTTGVIYNKKFVRSVASWGDLWQKTYTGRVGFLKDEREAIGAAEKLLGFSLNEKDPKNLAVVEKKLDLLKEQKVKYLSPNEIKEAMIEENLWLAQVYSGDALSMVEENENFVYTLPKEGTSIWVDNMMIPRKAKNKSTAEVFINYLLRPDVSAKNASELWYANPNFEAEKLMSKEVLNDQMVYPSAAVLEKSERMESIGDTLPLYNSIWAKLQQ